VLATLYEAKDRLPDLLALRRDELRLAEDEPTRIELRLEIARKLSELEARGGQQELLLLNLRAEPGHGPTLDAITTLLDARGRLIASSTATTLMHSASLRESLHALLIDVPVATMQHGDVFAQNDPFNGGIHANDIAVLRPVFGPDGSGPHYFAGTIIHVADIGGGYAGGVAATAQDMFAEGVIIPLNVSVGWASYPADGFGAGELTHAAMRAMRREKGERG
jgi:hypothetical protein